VRTVFEQLRSGGRVRRGEIGLRTQTITPALAAALGLPRPRGVLVRDVIPRSPADAAGLRIGDVVTTLDGRPVENARQLDVGLYRKPVGSGVVIEVVRGGDTLRAVPVAAQRPDDPESVASLASSPENLDPALGILALDLDERILPRLPGLRARAGVVVAAGVAAPPSPTTRCAPAT
jgi:membrane-associated protease RseP (regulator of RpoE activity)